MALSMRPFVMPVPQTLGTNGPKTFAFASFVLEGRVTQEGRKEKEGRRLVQGL